MACEDLGTLHCVTMMESAAHSEFRTTWMMLDFILNRNSASVILLRYALVALLREIFLRFKPGLHHCVEFVRILLVMPMT